VAEISAKLVKELRDQTGAGMMECKRALVETNGDLEAAKRLLREKGKAAAGKRADRETTEGLVGYRVADDASRGTLVAVGCESEQVSKTDEFQAFARKVLEAVQAGGVEAAESLEHERLELSGQLHENVAVVGAARFEAVDGGRVSVGLRGADPELARQLAMHISWSNPRWIGRDDVPEQAVTDEREILASTDEVKSKPEQAREKIVEGMLSKRFFGVFVLEDQEWIHDSSKKVGDVLRDAGAEVLEFERFALAG